MLSKADCLDLIRLLSAIESILRFHNQTNQMPDYIWEGIAENTEKLASEVLNGN